MIVRQNPRWLAVLLATVLGGAIPAPGQTEPPHPILSISGSGSGADNIINNYTESQYTNNFVPRRPPRNDSYGFAPPVVSGDTGWSWSASNPNQITSTPSGTIFPNTNAALYPVRTQAVTVFFTTATNNLTKTVNALYYNKAGSTTVKSLVLNLIDYRKLGQLRSDLNKLAPAYVNSGSTPSTRNDIYARRIAVALLDWARWHPGYYLTAINSASFIDVTPNYLATTTGFGPQRASDHNGLAHEWADDELLAFDAIYSSVALTNLSAEFGFDVRQYICDHLFFDEGDFLVNHIPVDIAIQSNLSGPYAILPLVARVLNRPDYILWMDAYLDATVRRKIRRDGALEEGMGYSIGYLNANQDAAQNTRDYFLTRAATNSLLLAISNRAVIYNATFAYGQSQWNSVSLPSGQLPSFGDTPFNNYFSAHSAGNSALLPAYGTLALGAGSGSQAVQVNQNFSGNNNHMRADMNAYVLWAFNNEYLGNIRYYNGAIGRNFGEQMLAYNTVTIDRANLTPYPDADTYGNGDLTLYEPGNSGVALTEIDGQRAYSGKASRFQRLLLLNTVDLARPYLVDVFRVTGGTTHDYVFHGSVRWDQNWQCSAPLVTNSNPYPMLEGSETWDLSTDTPYYGFWRNVSSNTAPGDFQITYADTGGSHRDTRLWMTADPNTYNVYIGTTPVPARDNTVPTNFFNYLGLTRPSAIIRHRIPSGTLQDLFVSVVEPLNAGVSNIDSVTRLPMSGTANESVGLQITFKDGRVDTCVVNLRNPQVAGANTGSATVSTTNGQYSLTGRVGVYSEGPAGARAWIMNGTQFEYPGGTIAPTNLYYSGEIAGETRRLTGGAEDALVTTTPLPLGSTLRGKPLSLKFGTLSGSGTTGISEMFQIDHVTQSGGSYFICFTHDHFLEITDAVSVSGSGSDIWGTGDQFHYAYEAANGDVVITARVAAQDNTSTWAKSGVMIRESTAADASYAGVYVTPGNGVSIQFRNGTGASAIDLGRQTGLSAPCWVRLTRAGNTFTGYYSLDGAAWSAVGQTNITMAAAATAGLAVTAHDNSALNTSTFDHVSLTLPLTSIDIGTVGLAGSVSYTTATAEQVAPLRTFTGTNWFEIALSASQPASPPAAPTGLVAIPGNTQVLLNWNGPGAESYNVKRSTASGGPYSTIANPVMSTFTDSGLANGATYYYVVSALNQAGESPNSVEASATPNAQAPTGMVTRLTFDDGAATDSSGFGNNGVLHNGAVVVDDPERGKVLSLDGVDDYVDLGNASSLDLSAAGQATIAAWAKVAVTHNHNSILSKGEWKEAYSLIVKGDTTPANELWTGNDTSVFSADPVPLNTWTHVAVVINSDLATFYINGQMSGAPNQDRGNPIDNTSVGVSIGREQYAGSLPAGRWFFNGELDDVRIYRRALSQAEIQNLMVTPEPPITAAISVEGDHLVLSWTGGAPPFQVEVNANLSETNWMTHGSPVDTNRLAIAPTNAAAFYRIRSQ